MAAITHAKYTPAYCAESAAGNSQSSSLTLLLREGEKLTFKEPSKREEREEKGGTPCCSEIWGAPPNKQNRESAYLSWIPIAWGPIKTESFPMPINGKKTFMTGSFSRTAL